MSKQSVQASKALVALSSYLALEVVQRPEHADIVKRLAFAVSNCSICAADLVPVRGAASRYLSAADHKSRSAAQIRLAMAVRQYHLLKGLALCGALRQDAEPRR